MQSDSPQIDATPRFRACAVVPVYNHEYALPILVNALHYAKVFCILVDDGSGPDCAEVMDELNEAVMTYLVRLPSNQGKGCAVMAGFRQAASLGFTHVMQIDADCQHDLNDIPRFLALAEQYPQSVICGYAHYDESIPKSQQYLRKMFQLGTWIDALTFSIRDSMCGFRVYPLKPTLTVIDSAILGKRMDFDAEILVRMSWRNQPMLWLPTEVRAPLDGISSFRPIVDSLQIFLMQIKLFFGMLHRAPCILWHRLAAR